MRHNTRTTETAASQVGYSQKQSPASALQQETTKQNGICGCQGNKPGVNKNMFTPDMVFGIVELT
jgi:hypothetical protein